MDEANQQSQRCPPLPHALAGKDDMLNGPWCLSTIPELKLSDFVQGKGQLLRIKTADQEW